MAVREVNLVPEAVLQRRYARRHGVGWAVAYGLLVVLLFGVYLHGLRSVTAKRRPTTEAQVRSQLTDAVGQIETRKQELERLAVVREIACPVGAAEILGRLAQAIPPETWLTQLSVTTQRGHGADVVMEGLTVSNSSLGAMIRALTESDGFQDIVLGKSSELRRPGSAGIPEVLVQFSVNAKAVME